MQAVQTLGHGQYVAVHVLMNEEATALTSEGEYSTPNVVLTNGPLGYVYGFVAENESHAIFSLLVYGKHARRFHMAPRSVKVRDLLGELDAMFPGFEEHVVSTHVYTYHPAAIATWRPGVASSDALWLLMVLGSASLALDLAQRHWGTHTFTLSLRPVLQGMAYGGALVALILFSGSQPVPFIYFQF